MTTIPEIRDALAARLDALDGVRAAQEWGAPINVSGSAMVAVVEYDGAVYDSVMDGDGDLLTFKITVLASKVSDRAGRAKLDAACDPFPTSATSVRAGVTGTLGGEVAYAVVTAGTGYREYTVGVGEGAAQYLGAEFTVSVAT